jgi:UDPglucose 6-dehydrogenase
MNVAVVGLGKLGLPIAVTLAEKMNVIGTDTNHNHLTALAAGEFTTTEPGVDVHALGRIKHYTGAVNAAAGASDFTFVIVPTPSDGNGRFSNEYVLAACKEIGRGMQGRNGQTIVIVSTVMPGSMDSSICLALESASGLRAGRDFNLLYSPQMVALGSVIRDFTHPDLLIIGKYGLSLTQPLLKLYDRILKSLPQIAVTDCINAELAKLSLNCAISSKIHFMNQLARVVENIPGADVDTITDIMGADRRIGRAYTKAGIMVGGPCFPRDLRAMSTLPGAVWFNRIAQHNETSWRSIAQTLRATKGVIGILGVSYKVGTDVTEESVGEHLQHAMLNSGREVHVDSTHTPEEVVAMSDIVVVTLPDQRYSDISLAIWTLKPRIVIDCWRTLRHLHRAHEHLTYIPVGVGPWK